MRNLDFQINQQQQQQQHLQNPISFQETQPHNLEIQHPNLYHQLLQNNQDYGNNSSLNPSQAEEVPPASRQNARGRQRTSVKSSSGEIVQVQGGHIVRSIGRKDRHSKVCTAKGPRDRRVRLSAHTAIEFYDVQDRLGYDRPSKAVDWLIKKAKSAIDKLAELPPWNPTDDANNNDQNMETEEQNIESSHEMNIGEQSDASVYNFQVRNNNETAPSFVSSIDPDTMKSLFPTSSSNTSINFQNYPHQDLGLSLHSFQYQGLIEGQSHSQPGTSHTPSNHLSAGSAYESNMMSWSNNTNSPESTRVGGGGIGFSFSPLPMPLQQVILNQDSSQIFSQRGSLQSNFSQFRAWNDQQITIASAEQQRNQEIHHQPFIFGSRFTPEGLAAGYNIPARIRGDEDQSLVNSDHRPSSNSPNSQH